MLANGKDNGRPTILSTIIASAPSPPPVPEARRIESSKAVPNRLPPYTVSSDWPTVSIEPSSEQQTTPSSTEFQSVAPRGRPPSHEPTTVRSRSPSATVHSRLPSYMPSDWPTVPIRPSEYPSNPKTSSSKAPMPKVRRKLANGSNSGGAPSLGPAINAGSSPPTPGTRRRNNPTRRPNYSFSAASSRPICNKATVEESLGQADHICPEDDLSSGKSNCCENAGDYSCETCAACEGRGQILDGLDDMGHSW